MSFIIAGLGLIGWILSAVLIKLLKRDKRK